MARRAYKNPELEMSGEDYIESSMEIKEVIPVTNEVLFEVNGLKIRRNSCYQIVGKEDLKAPQVFIKYGVSKLPNPEVQEVLGMIFDERYTKCYDTGFYSASLCYKRINKDEVGKQVRLRREHVLEPYEAIVGEGELEHTNNSFWDDYKSRCYHEKTFYTSDPVQMLDLYLLIQSFHITPVELIGDPRFNESLYCVQDKNLAVDVTQRRIQERYNAIGEYQRLKCEARKHLDYVLTWNGILSTENLDKGLLDMMFNAWVEDKENPTRAEEFNTTVELLSGPEAVDILRTFYNLEKLKSFGRLNITKQGIMIEGFDLGVNLKEAARRLVVDPKFANARLKVLEAMGEGE